MGTRFFLPGKWLAGGRALGAAPFCVFRPDLSARRPWKPQGNAGGRGVAGDCLNRHTLPFAIRWRWLIGHSLGKKVPNACKAAVKASLHRRSI